MAPPHPWTSPGPAVGGVDLPAGTGPNAVSLLDARVAVDEFRLATHELWASGLTGAIFGPVDPFDLVTAIADRFAAIRGRVEVDRFVVGDGATGPSAVMVSADHGSAAMFTTNPADASTRDRFVALFDPTDPFDETMPAVRVELVDRAMTSNQELAGIVTTGTIGSARVFDDLAMC